MRLKSQVPSIVQFIWSAKVSNTNFSVAILLTYAMLMYFSRVAYVNFILIK